jgi:hypothetical protein
MFSVIGAELGAPSSDDGIILDHAELVLAESDHWLRNMIEGLSGARVSSPERLRLLGESIATILAKVPRELVAVEVEVEDLRRILSLPVWRRRHEVYAVWIATQIVHAMPAKTKIEHEGGNIRFAFKRSKVAFCARSTAEISLFAERKQPLANPLGKNRKNNTQPDFSLLRVDQTGERCSLVIEVKHYAKAAPRPFSEVLVDYARSHREAQVVLVNYGPTADIVDSLDDASDPVGDRCHHIPDLTPLNSDARERLTMFVRNGVNSLDFGAHLVIDISHSMKGWLTTDTFRTWLEGPRGSRFDHVILADCKCRWRGPREEALDWIATHRNWTGEALVPISLMLLCKSPAVSLVTDGSGFRELRADVALDVEIQMADSPPGLILVKVALR